MTDEPMDEAEATGATRAPDDAGREGPASDDGDSGSRPRITRGRDGQKVLAGVCHGAGRYFGVDPVIFRVVLAVLSLTGGIGLIVYGMGWLIVPQEGEEQSEAHRLLSGRIEGTSLTAVLMALVGCGLYASTIGNGENQAFSLILLFATAGAVYWSQQRARGELAGEAAASVAAAAVDAPPAVQAPPEPGGSPSWWRDPLSKEPPAYLWGPDDGPYGEEDRRAWRERKKTARRERSWLFGFAVLLLALTAAGTAFGVAWPYQPVTVSVELALASALGVFGTAFVVSAFAGRARTGTVFLSLVTVAALIGTASLPKDKSGWTTTWRPAAASAVQPSYERGMGSGTLDLTGLALGAGNVETRLEVHVGEAVVKLPRNATVTLVYHVGLGDVLLPDHSHSGVDIKNDRNKTLTYAPPPGTASTGTIDVHVTVGVGDLRVVR